MSFLLDHLAAALVTGILLVGLIVIQQRGQQRSVEATVRHQNHTLTSGFLDTVQRDVENIRTASEMGWAFGGDDTSVDSTRFSVTKPGTPHTTQFVFPTLLDPDNGSGGEVAIVGYEVTETGRTVEAGGTTRPTLRVRRYVYRRGSSAPVENGGSGDLVDFDVELFGPAGRRDTNETDIDYTPSQVHIEAASVALVPERQSYDQRGSSASAVTRHARTAYVASAGAEGGRPATDRSLPQGIPAFPGD